MSYVTLLVQCWISGEKHAKRKCCCLSLQSYTEVTGENCCNHIHTNLYACMVNLRQFNGEIEWQVKELATKPEFELRSPAHMADGGEAFKLSGDHHICALVSPLSLNTQ